LSVAADGSVIFVELLSAAAAAAAAVMMAT